MTRVAWCLTNIFTQLETLFFSWYELYLRYDMKIIALYTDIRQYDMSHQTMKPSLLPHQPTPSPRYKLIVGFPFFFFLFFFFCQKVLMKKNSLHLPVITLCVKHPMRRMMPIIDKDVVNAILNVFWKKSNENVLTVVSYELSKYRPRLIKKVCRYETILRKEITSKHIWRSDSF